MNNLCTIVYFSCRSGEVVKLLKTTIKNTFAFYVYQKRTANRTNGAI